ncbi:transposase [Pseudomonas daroniae]|uniref:Transposase n=1 Tax=Phytopseudomonas daroniae TaxID=2487519 RepID=A0A4Q9QHA6_9GAMM|nr:MULTISPECIES: transposase [Pseudomonas]TBU72670.1 transposase [Pseudomonas sp. FRB 228]TBU74276.1 transposase [Pseudomonas daroniae]TBU85557.1 transposase [Pseudomonas daroniae]
MTGYRRHYRAGGVYFFTLTLADRRRDWLVSHIDVLRQSVREEQRRAPFALQAWVVLPEHLHLLVRLPDGDSDFSNRLRRIKGNFSRQIPLPAHRRQSLLGKGERGIWQRRFWEHAIRDQEDWQRHIEYIHHNPVKHGLVDRVRDWPYSSFHAYVQRGDYPLDWGWAAEEDIPAGE